ncbi:homoserine kinase [Rhodomicrobium vannielii ATCC 17100]|uniref:Homoserine kinase n=1 Tax=Rhodomicrobium vannielii (strain ATCC 17100 / DSM 162 / LMG 4299 / NCIMB 10020 / ATH 3.1.1) TaxID=648757 RepID=E3I3D4_RHOVT|nr:homoserine kinase [Rhodomicrobium vannielii]ADP72582.1 homoserine kinase [Rhodomicrobium vannielii ATCC 17100]
MAVYTEVSVEDLDALLAKYDIGQVLAFKGIAEGVENSNFYLGTDKAQYILTLYEKRVAAGDLPFFLGLMEHLAQKGVNCPLPVHDLDGRILQTLAGKPAAFVTFLPGYSLKRPQPVHCHSLGEAIARLHLAGRDFALHRDNALSVAGWQELFASIEGLADRLVPKISVSLIRHLDDIAAHWPSNLPRGVIHADLFPDNVFFLDNRVSGLIDFYFACNDLFAYDLAICMNAWCFELDGAFNVTKARALFAGYNSVRALDEAEVAALPLLAKGAAIRFFLTRAYDWFNTPDNAFVKRKDPMEYWRKLAFHDGVKHVGAYGL